MKVVKGLVIGVGVLSGWAVASSAFAQSGAAKPATGTPAATADTRPAPAPTAAPPGFVIGPEDVLSVVFWREADVSGDVVVRPDGMISIPLLRDVQAAGLTPEQLATQLEREGSKYFEKPTVTVTVKQINSRKVFITGQVLKPGAYPLSAPTSVLQLIAIAGGLNEYADQENISVMRTENGKPISFRFNYKDVSKRKKLDQNVLLKPGDTVIVP
jgi:polysaccharide export outer membrane protein